jgi:hypothetical protein
MHLSKISRCDDPSSTVSLKSSEAPDFTRRTWMKWLAVAGGIFIRTSVGRSQDFAGFDINQAEQMLDLNSVELRIQLQNGLRVFLPQQQTFLNTVLAAVDNGLIPRAMVNLVYVWSLRRNPKVPFPYFQVAVRALAARRGVTL